MIKLYQFPRSGNSREVKIVLHEKNIPFESINIHATDFKKDDAEFRKASPQGKVPAIIDQDTYLSESFLISQYLDEKYPAVSLMPKDESERTRIREWVAHYDKKLVHKIGLLVIECLLKPKDQQSEETKQRHRGEILTALKELDIFLSGKDYLFGDYSLADAAVTPHLSALPMLGVVFPKELKNLASWFSRIRQRPSFALSAS